MKRNSHYANMCMIIVECGDEWWCLQALACEIRVGCLFVGFLEMLVKVREMLRRSVKKAQKHKTGTNANDN